eukprot:GAFH01004445.1.p5 GENE.GAFH01004445.1~~GAFH01004445.1.p5  ORF type:complete len:69 (+),score=1.05 GAFH01004445.1:564-770(+)
MLTEHFLIPVNYALFLRPEMAVRVGPILERLLPPNYDVCSEDRAYGCLKAAFDWVEANGGVPGGGSPT